MKTTLQTIKTIELDHSIQCRAQIDTALLSEYAQAMTAGAKFPPVDIFGTKARCWIGDGWHRILAAKLTDANTIAANLHPGGRAEALKYALSANAVHGARRSNEDKRRCVEIALREFPKLSTAALAGLCGVSRPFIEGIRQEHATVACSEPEPRIGLDGKARKMPERAVAQLCGVHHDLVATVRPKVAESATCARTGQDGKQYPALRPATLGNSQGEPRVGLDGKARKMPERPPPPPLPEPEEERPPA